MIRDVIRHAVSMLFRPISPNTSELRDFELLADSQFFDRNQYSVDNPELARMGLDPIRHYLEYGAAHGRNPSTLFDTNWYMAKNPDVNQTGLNPLVHYLRIGCARGSEPHPMLALFKSKPSEDRAEIEALLHAVHAVGDPGAIAGRASQSVWAHHFLYRGAAALSQGHLNLALDMFKHAAQLRPGDSSGWLLFGHAFRLLNAETLAAFKDAQSERSSLLVVHIACAEHLAKARHSCRGFIDHDEGVVQNVIITAAGDPNTYEYHFDADSGVLTVPAGDSYEALPMKIARLLLFLGFSNERRYILKVDDDVQCADIKRLIHDFKTHIRGHDYGGNVIFPPSRTEEGRHWHFNKCSDMGLNLQPDTQFFWKPWVAGGYYWLSPSAVNLLSKVVLLHSRYVENELYEDRTIGNVLQYYGIHPKHLKLVETGSLASDGW